MHGEHAIATWVTGRIAGVSGALLRDGSRCNLMKPGDPEIGGWRRGGTDGRWIHGFLEVTTDDIVFVDDTSRTPMRKWHSGTLAADLQQSPEVVTAVQDIAFAMDLYGAMCSLGWRNIKTGREYWGTWRRAGEIVASLRDLDECYTDFFLSGGEGLLTQEVQDLFASVGWHVIRAADRDSRHRRAINVLKACEQRPFGDTPEWYRQWGLGLNAVWDHRPEVRMHYCAVSGQASLDEWDSFWEMIDLDA